MEKILDQKEIKEISKKACEDMPDLVKGIASVDPGKIFNEFASHSALSFILYVRKALQKENKSGILKNNHKQSFLFFVCMSTLCFC